MQQTMILVGNGPSVFNQELGQYINKFDIVIRFNNFQIKGYEKYIGTKTDILFRRACDDVIWHPKEWFKLIVCAMTYCKWTPWMSTVVKYVLGVYGDICKVLPPDVTKVTGEKLGLNQPMKEWCSQGILAIDYFVHQFSSDFSLENSGQNGDLTLTNNVYYGIIVSEPIVIHGFDHLVPSQSGQILHYFPTKPKDHQYHRGDLEKQFTDNLINKGKICRLEEYIKNI